MCDYIANCRAIKLPQSIHYIWIGRKVVDRKIAPHGKSTRFTTPTFSIVRSSLSSMKITAQLLPLFCAYAWSISTPDVLRLLPDPAMKLYGIVSPNKGWGAGLDNNWTKEDANIASMLEFVYGGRLSDSTANMLRGRTHRIKYKNYGGTDKKMVESAELDHHQDIAYYRPGLLTQALSSNTELPFATLQIFRAPHVPHYPQLPWDNQHPGGLKASTAPGNHTVAFNNGTVTSYLTWLRVGDEYMKIIKVEVGPKAPYSPDATAVVTVGRGLFGSPITAHAANSSVFAPVYHASGAYPGGDAGKG